MDSDLSTGPSASNAWVDDHAGQLAEQIEQARAFADRVGALSVTAASDDGAVRLTVAASGALQELRLEERVRQWPAERIAEQILQVMRWAQGQLAGKVAAIAAQTVGEHSAAGRDVVDAFTGRFPQLRPEQPEAPRRGQPEASRRGEVRHGW